MSEEKKNAMEELFDIQLPAEANYQLADPQFVQFYKNYKDRIIWIDKDIGDDLFSEIRLIFQWNKEDKDASIPEKDRKPIKIFIHSFGGNLDAAFAFIDAMNLSSTPIMTVNLNSALSAGALILINGHKGLRYCLPMSTALIHSGSGGSAGSYEKVVEQTENYKKVVNMMRENIISHTNITKQLLTKNSKKEWYIYAEEQVSLGICDKIVTSLDEILD